MKILFQRKNVNWIIMSFIGVLFLITVGFVYIPYFIKNGIHELELTFLSNTLAGVLFLSGGIYGFLKRKDFPQALYMYTTLVLQLVFIICMVFIKEFNFSGGFIFLHIVNPFLATVGLFLFTSYNRKPSIKIILIALIFPYAYLLYAIIYGYHSGFWIYDILNIPERGIIFVLSLVVIAGIGIIFLECIQFKMIFYMERARSINISKKKITEK